MILVVAATERELAGLGDGAEGLACGVGPVDAAATVAARLAAGARPEAILHVGIAGARRAAGLAPGTVVLGESALYCDTDSPLVASTVEPDPALLASLQAAFPQARTAPIGTGASVGGTHGCDVEGMEGFAVLRAAALAGVAAVELRVISNEVEEEDRARWHFAVGLDALAAALPRALDALSAR